MANSYISGSAFGASRLASHKIRVISSSRYSRNSELVIGSPEYKKYRYPSTWRSDLRREIRESTRIETEVRVKSKRRAILTDIAHCIVNGFALKTKTFEFRPKTKEVFVEGGLVGRIVDGIGLTDFSIRENDSSLVLLRLRDFGIPVKKGKDGVYLTFPISSKACSMLEIMGHDIEELLGRIFAKVQEANREEQVPHLGNWGEYGRLLRVFYCKLHTNLTYPIPAVYFEKVFLANLDRQTCALDLLLPEVIDQMIEVPEWESKVPQCKSILTQALFNGFTAASSPDDVAIRFLRVVDDLRKTPEGLATMFARRWSLPQSLTVDTPTESPEKLRFTVDDYSVYRFGTLNYLKAATVNRPVVPPLRTFHLRNGAHYRCQAEEVPIIPDPGTAHSLLERDYDASFFPEVETAVNSTLSQFGRSIPAGFSANYLSGRPCYAISAFDARAIHDLAAQSHL